MAASPDLVLQNLLAISLEDQVNNDVDLASACFLSFAIGLPRLGLAAVMGVPIHTGNAQLIVVPLCASATELCLQQGLCKITLAHDRTEELDLLQAQQAGVVRLIMASMEQGANYNDNRVTGAGPDVFRATLALDGFGSHGGGASAYTGPVLAMGWAQPADSLESERRRKAALARLATQLLPVLDQACEQLLEDCELLGVPTTLPEPPAKPRVPTQGPCNDGTGDAPYGPDGGAGTTPSNTGGPPMGPGDVTGGRSCAPAVVLVEAQAHDCTAADSAAVTPSETPADTAAATPPEDQPQPQLLPELQGRLPSLYLAAPGTSRGPALRRELDPHLTQDDAASRGPSRKAKHAADGGGPTGKERYAADNGGPTGKKKYATAAGAMVGGGHVPSLHMHPLMLYFLDWQTEMVYLPKTNAALMLIRFCTSALLQCACLIAFTALSPHNTLCQAAYRPASWSPQACSVGSGILFAVSLGLPLLFNWQIERRERRVYVQQMMRAPLAF